MRNSVITVPIPIPSSTVGTRVKQLRLAESLSREELADLAHVPPEHVARFEKNLPVPLDSRRRIHKELWARKTKK